MQGNWSFDNFTTLQGDNKSKNYVKQGDFTMIGAANFSLQLLGIPFNLFSGDKKYGGVTHTGFCTLELLSYLLESKDGVDGEGFPLILGEGANNLGDKNTIFKSNMANICDKTKDGTSCPSLYCATCSY